MPKEGVWALIGMEVANSMFDRGGMTSVVFQDWSIHMNSWGGDGLNQAELQNSPYKNQLTSMGAGTGRRPGGARLQHSLAHAKARTEHGPYKTGLQNPSEHLQSRDKSNLVGELEEFSY